MQSLGADTTCSTAIQVIQCWRGPRLPERIALAQLHQWQMCLQTRGGLKTQVTSIRRAASFEKLGFVLAGTSAVRACCTLHINTPSDSISLFILTNVGICGYDEAIMWQSLCRVSPLLLPTDSAMPDEPYPHLSWQPPRHWAPCFLGPWLLSHNSA